VSHGLNDELRLWEKKVVKRVTAAIAVESSEKFNVLFKKCRCMASEERFFWRRKRNLVPLEE
jgi:hypothetical protein